MLNTANIAEIPAIIAEIPAIITEIIEEEDLNDKEIDEFFAFKES